MMNRSRFANTLLLTGALTCTASFAGIGTAFADTTAPTTTVTEVAAKAQLPTTRTVETKTSDAKTTKTAETKTSEATKSHTPKAETKKADTTPAPTKDDAKGSKGSKPQTDVSTEQQDGCDHGATGKACKPDPQPTHGKECQTHGKTGGVNENHCDDVPVVPADTKDPVKPTTDPTKPVDPEPTKPTTDPTKPVDPTKPDVDPTKPGDHDPSCSICKHVPVFPPVTTPVCGSNNDIVILPEAPGVIWNKGEWKDGSIVITATSADGFTFGDHESETFVLTDKNVACDTTTPGKPEVPGTPEKPGKPVNPDVPVVPQENPTKPVVVVPVTPGTPTTPVTPGTPVVVVPVKDVPVAPQGDVTPVSVRPQAVAPQGSTTPVVVTADTAVAPQSSGAAPFFKSGIDDEPASPLMPLSLAGGGLALGLVAAISRRRRTN